MAISHDAGAQLEGDPLEGDPLEGLSERCRGSHLPVVVGHGVRALECNGVRALLQRGTEWAATGRVTLPLPDVFPTEHTTAQSSV